MTVSRNIIIYTANERDAGLIISGVVFGRDMKKIYGGPDDIRTVIFPEMVRTVRQGAFNDLLFLRSVILNEGLETLGTDEYRPDGEQYPGVFQKSLLERVRFPSTLKRIEYNTFRGCRNLKNIDLPEKLEYIGESCFSNSALESVILPNSLKIIGENSFFKCESLENVIF